ncbi:MAG: carboxypeptidase regulatory-like domain-containing protein [Planctomycetota bacterium]
MGLRARSKLPWIAAVALGLVAAVTVAVIVVAPGMVGMGPAKATGPGLTRAAGNAVDIDGAAGGGKGRNGRGSGNGEDGDADPDGVNGANGSAGRGNGNGNALGDGLSGGGVNVGPGIGHNSGGAGGGVTPTHPTDADGRHYGPKSDYSSDGHVEREGGDEKTDDNASKVPTEWIVQFTDGDKPVQVAVGVFRPAPPMEIRVDGLYGKGSPLGVNSYTTDAAGRLVLPMAEALALAGVNADLSNPDVAKSLTGALGIFVDEVSFEQIVVTLPLLQGPTPPTITLTHAHFVEIKVRHEVSNKAVPGALVELWRYDPANPDGQPMDVLQLRTDDLGTITSRIMPGRSYAFRVRCEGYATTPIERFTCHKEDVHYNLPLYPGNFLAGVVQDEGGNPVAGATVTAMLHGNDGDGSDEAVTDAFGQFTVTRVPHNDFTSDVWVTVVAEGFATLVTTALANAENVLLVVKQDGAVTGQVLPPPGAALRLPVKVLATQALYNQKNGFTFPPFQVKADGTFSLSGLAEGEVTLVAQSEFGEISEPVKLNYVPGAPTTAVLQLAASAGAFVRVATSEAGVPGIQVAIGEWRGVTDMAGTVHFTDLAPGQKIKCSVVPDDPQASLVTGADGNSYFLPAAQEITLQSGQSTEVTFTLVLWTPPPVLTPVVVVFSGDTLVAAPGKITLTVTYTSGGVEVSNANVTFVNGIGTANITIRSDASTKLDFSHPDYRGLSLAHAALQSAGESQTPISVPLERQASLSFQVIDPAEGNVADVGVQIQVNGKTVQNKTTDAAGRVQFTNLDNGPVRVVAFKHGYRQAIFDLDVPVLQVFEPIRNEDGSVLEVAGTGNGTSSSPSELRLTISNAGDFHVIVTNEQGQAAVGADLWVMRNQKPGSPLEIFNLGKLDGQGGKTVRLHWDVEYQLVVVNGTSIAYSHFFNDPGKPVYSIELQMERKATISGHLVDGANKAMKDVEVRLVQLDGKLSQTPNYFSVKTNKNGDWSIDIPDDGTWRALLPDKTNTTPIDGLLPGQQEVIIIAGS